MSAFALAVAGSIAPAASTSGTVVGAEVPGATFLDTAGCPSNTATKTSFGSVVPGTSNVTSADCSVVFGSSNATATLLAYQSSPRSTAMAAPTTVVVDSTPSGRVMDLSMVDASNGWMAMADSGASRIWSTSDGGASWTVNANGSTAVQSSAAAISAASTSVVWAARYANPRITRTADGGSTWVSSALPGTTPRANALYAVSGTTAYATGYDDGGGPKNARIWKTIDTGTTWTTQLTEVDTTSVPTDISFAAGTNRGYMVTQFGELFRTTDGSTWTKQFTTGNNLEAVSAYDLNHAMTVGSYGQVRVTSDGGTTWAVRDMPDSVPLKDVAYRSSGVAWAVGENGTLYRSLDDGQNWSTMSSKLETGYPSGIEAMSDSTVVIGSYASSVVRTTDSGTTWTRAASPAPGTNWTGMDGADGASAWRVGSAGRIERTSDGTTWTPQTSGVTNAFYDVLAQSRTSAIAIGTAGTILRTTDSGATWTPVVSGTTANLRAIAQSPAGHVWIVGDGGLILRSTNRGVSFYTVASGTATNLTAVTAVTDDTIITGSGPGVLRRSTNAGASWSVIASPGSSWVGSLSAIPGTTTVWLAQGAYLARSTASGSAWSSTNLGSGEVTYDIDGIDGQVAWTAGRYGAIRRTTNGGTTWTSLTGFTTTRSATSVLGLGTDDAFAIGDAGTTARVQSGTTVPDYGDAGSTWAGANSLFGICLVDAPGTTAIWPRTGACPTTDGTNWRGVPDHGGAPEAPVATTLAAGNVTAGFRFGLKVATSQPATTYSSSVTFEVQSP